MRNALVSVLMVVVLATPVVARMSDMPMDMPQMMMSHCSECMHRSSLRSLDTMSGMVAMCLRHAKDIGLADDQVAQIKSIHTGMQKSGARFEAEVKIAEIDLADILEEKDFDLDKAKAAVKKIEEIQSAHHAEMLTALKEIRSLVTEEQFGKMKKMMFDGGEEHKHMEMMKKAK